jgi:manganese/iron transport system permease protein
MSTLARFITSPFAYPFMIRGLLASIMVGGVCSLVGCYIVLRGMAFLGDALAHSILPGVAIGFLVEGRGDRRALFWWALATAVLVAFGIGTISQKGKLREDTAIGIVFAGMFALGIALISTVRGFAVDLVHFLFGNVLAVSWWDLCITAGFGALVILMIILFYKEFLVISFDPILAKTLRLHTAFYHYLLLVLIAIAVVVSLQTVGVGLMLATLVTPPSTAYLLTRRLSTMMLLAVGLGALSGVMGLFLSYYVQIASGAAIVLVMAGIFLITFLLTSTPGLLRKLLLPRQKPTHG